MSGGRTFSEEHRANLSAALKGRRWTEERRAKVRETKARRRAEREREAEEARLTEEETRGAGHVTVAEAIRALEWHGYDVLLRERPVSTRRTGPGSEVRPAGSAGTGSRDHRSLGESRKGGPGIGTKAPTGERDSGPRARARTYGPPGVPVAPTNDNEGERS